MISPDVDNLPAGDDGFAKFWGDVRSEDAVEIE